MTDEELKINAMVKFHKSLGDDKMTNKKSYPYSIYRMQVENHRFWVAECPMLNGCVGQGETPTEAIEELEANKKVWIETAEEYGIIPKGEEE